MSSIVFQKEHVARCKALLDEKSKRKVTVLELYGDEQADEESGGLETALAIAAVLEEDRNIVDATVCSYGPVGAELAAGFARTLKLNNHLVRLDLSNNNIGPHGAQLLASVLACKSQLAVLNLVGNCIGASGAAALASALSTNRSLESLYLYGNAIGPHGGRALAWSLYLNESLQHLYIDNNDLGPSCGEAFAQALEANKTIKTLALSTNQLGPSGGMALAKVLPHCFLEDLFLDENELGPAVGAALAQALSSNTRLKSISLWSNGLDQSFATLLVAVLQRNETLLRVGLGNNVEIENSSLVAVREVMTGNLVCSSQLPLIVDSWANKIEALSTNPRLPAEFVATSAALAFGNELTDPCSPMFVTENGRARCAAIAFRRGKELLSHRIFSLLT